MSPTFTPPSQTNVCTASSGIKKKKPRKSHSSTRSSDLGQGLSCLRPRRKSLPTQSTDLPRTSQSLVAEGQDLVLRTTEQTDRPFKRAIESEDSLPQKRARRESSQEFKASLNTLRPTGVHAIKPLTRTNLNLFQESMSNSASTL